MHKYQFTIFEYSDKINNSASTKAIADCNKIFTDCGYHDYTLIVNNDSGRKLKFYLTAFFSIMKFLTKVEKGSLVGIQYPMLNNVFKYFIKVAKIKKIKFFCIIHDVESLRLGGTDLHLVKKEISNLYFYDLLIVHNDAMLLWLKNQGVKRSMIPLKLFDYLKKTESAIPEKSSLTKTIVFAGNLAKSSFVYSLGEIYNWKFNLYGPNFNERLTIGNNTNWLGVFSPDEILDFLQGDFGLIWDGDSVTQSDAAWSNYLKYNNPHKLSLYIAAGIPVIAPKTSAIGQFIIEENIGLLVNDLTDLNFINIKQEQYNVMRSNCLRIRKQITNGEYFKDALNVVENHLS